MTDSNQYQSPQSQVDNEQAQEQMQPKIFSVSGRIGRVRFLAYIVAVYLLLGIPLQVLGSFAMLAPGDGDLTLVTIYGVLSIVVLIVEMVFFFMFAIQRSHDMNSSGWLSLIILIPLVGFLIFLFAPGSGGSNRFGPAPTPNGVGVILLALVMPIISIVGILAAIAIPAYNGYINKVNEAQQLEEQR